MRIRAAETADLPALQDIEKAAGLCFGDIGMPEINEYQPLPLAELAVYQQSGRAWVAVEEAGDPVAYLLADLVDGNLIIAQVSVHPDSARRGIGRSLIDHVADEAVAAGITALTLTTFSQVPWNAPYYERCGFRRLDEAELTPGLRAIRRHEAEMGLDRWPRLCMRRDL